MIDRQIFFDNVRPKPFSGALTQQQVDGMNAIIDAWEADYESPDLRWLANPLAQTFHETGGEMWPIEEYKGSDQSYGKVDPQTGQAYYGRGYIQCTHRENYARADKEIGLSSAECTEYHADNMLRPDIAAQTMFEGMIEGWFRSKDGKPCNLPRYFNETTNDVFNAREIINGDKNTVPTWSNGVSIGKLVQGYHEAFLAALELAYVEEVPVPEPEANTVIVSVIVPEGIKVRLIVNGDEV